MQRLWTFGDSFTAGCGCLDNEVFTIKYKKSDEDKIWPEIVASKLNFQLKNMGAGLFSNDKILDSIKQNLDLFLSRRKISHDQMNLLKHWKP